MVKLSTLYFSNKKIDPIINFSFYTNDTTRELNKIIHHSKVEQDELHDLLMIPNYYA